MTENEKEKGALLLASLGALVVSVSLFAATFGLGSRNGEFGRWQIGGVLAGFCLVLYPLFRALPSGENVWRVMRPMVAVSVVVTASALAAAMIRSTPSPYPGADCSWPTPFGWVTCTISFECGVVGRWRYNVNHDPETWRGGSYDLPGCSL